MIINEIHIRLWAQFPIFSKIFSNQKLIIYISWFSNTHHAHIISHNGLVSYLFFLFLEGRRVYPVYKTLTYCINKSERIRFCIHCKNLRCSNFEWKKLNCSIQISLKIVSATLKRIQQYFYFVFKFYDYFRKYYNSIFFDGQYMLIMKIILKWHRRLVTCMYNLAKCGCENLIQICRKTQITGNMQL